MKFRLTVDIGETFTDLCIVDERGEMTLAQPLYLGCIRPQNPAPGRLLLLATLTQYP